MKKGLLFFTIPVGFLSCHAQPIYHEYVNSIDIDSNDNYDGFQFLDTEEKHLFFLAESQHAIRMTPVVTLKFLKYLHDEANVRILAIEHGYSVEYLINQYLDRQDTTLLRQISRNSMYWGKENYAFLKELALYNNQLPDNEKILVKSIDIEYKQESALLLIRKLIGEKEIPIPLIPTLGEFKRIVDDKKEHREQFDGLNLLFYYDKAEVANLVSSSLSHIESSKKLYSDFFNDDFTHFNTIIEDLEKGIRFDYTNSNSNYKYRDDIIYEKFVSLIEEHPNTGILCAIGLRHTTEKSSGNRLDSQAGSPLVNKVMTIRISALQKKGISKKNLRKLNDSLDDFLLTNRSTLIKHDKTVRFLRQAGLYDYTLFINDVNKLTPFKNSYYGKK